jgi:membrane fusion protein, adhesin transport system
MLEPIGKQGFERIGKVVKGGERVGRPLFDRLFGRWLVAPRRDGRDWVSDADWARIQQEPLGARTLLYAMVLSLAALVGWAGVAEVDEITRGEGRVIPASQLQVVQSVDGGVVDEILIHEGQVVEAGEVLMRVDPTRFVSSFRENRARSLSLRAKKARLEALIQGQAFDPPEGLMEEAPEIVEHERKLYGTTIQEMEAQLDIARQQLEQREQELNEAKARHAQGSRAFSLGSRELELTRPLKDSGAVSEVEVMRLERDVSRARGDRDQAAAQISRLNASIVEAKGKIEEVRLVNTNRLRNELSVTLSELAALAEGSVGLEDRVSRAEIKAPVKGTVQRLIINTRGGVVQPGTQVLELVPLEDRLVVEARIPPKDIAFLRPGQRAIVKFTAYDFAIYGGLEASLEFISADTITDEQGNTFYLARVRTRVSGFGEGKPVIPGMTTQVDILTGKKTILEYLLRPLLVAKANALTER